MDERVWLIIFVWARDAVREKDGEDKSGGWMYGRDGWILE